MKIIENLFIERLRQALVEELLVTEKEYGPKYFQLTQALLENLEIAIEVNCKFNKLDGHTATRAFCETIARMEARYDQISEEASAASRANN